MVRSAGSLPAFTIPEYRIGPGDLVDVTVFEAPELNRSSRVSAGGRVSLPLLGAVQAAGLTPRELEVALQDLLRRSYMKAPHVGVFVREMQSHPVSVFGAVERPGVFQIRGAKTLLEMLSLAEGLAEDAGDTVIVMRGAGFRSNSEECGVNPAGALPGFPADPEIGAVGGRQAQSIHCDDRGEAVEITLKDLLESADPQFNVPVYPGDIVKVTRAGVVYVVGEVRRPGGFLLSSNENISVLQALARAEGLTRTAARSRSRIIRTDKDTGVRAEIPLDLDEILAGRAPDPLLRPKDIVFVPNSAARSAILRGLEVTLQTISGVLIFRR
ncbi:MAG: polysaccharide biosynthesis/export family protein [Terriglobia bacterium]